MIKVLVSSCLRGQKVRYNAGSLTLPDSDNHWFQSNVEWMPFCPEVSAGLPIPRAPAEIILGKGCDVLEGAAHVMGNDGVDVTSQFIAGARNALKVCQQNQIIFAVLAENSPSCGSSKIYDGTFKGNKINGSGVTASLLTLNGIQVFSQHELENLKAAIEKTC